jgi:hypothetical protein
MLELLAEVRKVMELLQLLELVEMQVTHVVEVMAGQSVRAPLSNETVALDVAIQSSPFQPQLEMLLDDHASDRHADQGNTHL